MIRVSTAHCRILLEPRWQMMAGLKAKQQRIIPCLNEARRTLKINLSIIGGVGALAP